MRISDWSSDVCSSDLEEAAVITGTDAATIEVLLDEATADLDRESRTSVLIIQDEPLIALELEAIVRHLGHEVAGIATTPADAVPAVAASNAGLVPADIHLCDRPCRIDDGSGRAWRGERVSREV